MNYSTALVTGGTGFIARSLRRHLSQSGIRTTLLARAGASIPQDCDVVTVRDLSRESVFAALHGLNFDVVFHLAAYGVKPTDRDPATTFSANIGGIDAIVSAAAETGARAIVYLGSCSEYRNPIPGNPLSEDAPLGSTGLYGASKAAAGIWGEALASRLGIPFQWLRLFNVFGPGEGATRLVPALIDRLKIDAPVSLSPGEQVRDFLYIDDAVVGIALAAGAALAGRTGQFNLCSGQPITVREVALAVAAAMGKPSNLLMFGDLDYRPDENLWLVGHPEKFRRATGFVPRVSLAAGIEQMIAAEV
jgi:nucleoside-diphosphate-sugar epimerase